MQLPEGFLKQFAPYGVEALDRLADALSAESTACIRFNRSKGMKPADGYEIVGWCPEGVYLPERPAFTFDPALHQGRYYVQDSSSMFISHIIRFLTSENRPVRYLDACAAPGGKTTAALDVLPEGSIVVANEYVGQRAAVLRENLIKWGAPNVVVTQGDTSRFAADGAEFDIIAADVPCSGEGMMRKDPKARQQWSEALVDQCARRQREIIDNLWPALRPEGYLIYSTCTFNRRENEEMVEYMIERYGAEPIAIDGVDEDSGILPALASDMPAYRFVPGAVRGEGQFMAVVRKPGNPTNGQPSEGKKRKKKDRRQNVSKTATKLPEAVKCLCAWPEGTDFSIDPDGQIIATLPPGFSGFPYSPTVNVGHLKGKDIIPSQQIAMSTMLNRNGLTEVDLTRQQAIDYLRCQAVALPATTPRGIVLATYEGQPLGWMKNIGNRANNLYPKSWRILSDNPE